MRDGFLGAERGAALSALSCLLRAGANRARGIGDDKGAGGGECLEERQWIVALTALMSMAGAGRPSSSLLASPRCSPTSQDIGIFSLVAYRFGFC